MEELFKENAKLLYNYLCSLCHDESLAEELTQETFYKACLSIDRYDETCKFSTWLCQIGKHTYYQYLEKHKHISPTEITDELSVTEISAERHALSRIELLETLKHLHTLPEDMREVIYLRSFGDLSFREIGDIMGKSENCKKLYEQSKLEMLHNSSTTPKEIDYFKAIKLNVNKKNKTLLVVTGILLFIQIYFNFSPYHPLDSSELLTYTNYLSQIFIALVLFAVLPDFTEHSVPNKIKLPILGIEFAAMTYIFALMTFVGHHLLNDTLPFGMKAEDIGPFLATQILVLVVCFILTFIATLIISLRKKSICPALCFLPLGGLSLMFEYNHLLHEFTTRISLALFIQPYVVVMCEMIVLVGIYMFVNRKKVV